MRRLRHGVLVGARSAARRRPLPSERRLRSRPRHGRQRDADPRQRAGPGHHRAHLGHRPLPHLRRGRRRLRQERGRRRRGAPSVASGQGPRATCPRSRARRGRRAGRYERKLDSAERAGPRAATAHSSARRRPGSRERGLLGGLRNRVGHGRPNRDARGQRGARQEPRDATPAGDGRCKGQHWAHRGGGGHRRADQDGAGAAARAGAAERRAQDVEPQDRASGEGRTRALPDRARVAAFNVEQGRVNGSIGGGGEQLWLQWDDRARLGRPSAAGCGAVTPRFAIQRVRGGNGPLKTQSIRVVQAHGGRYERGGRGGAAAPCAHAYGEHGREHGRASRPGHGDPARACGLRSRLSTQLRERTPQGHGHGLPGDGQLPERDLLQGRGLPRQ
mmetsp:Transcript_23273/g.62414  ORF Transcript_23273/g.62414 Transcript_23273/m.62414 type:complete len:389 (+) Transcript_23273:3705-4871(+)